jgi:uncharacterized membrane protein YdbT with pleckstrin-like domain
MPGYIESLLGEREKIVLVTRQHWFTIASAVILEIVLIVILAVLTVIGGTLIPGVGALIWIFGAALILIPVATLTRDLLVWSNRQYIVTTRRVMQIAGIFNKNVTDSSLEKVNDVKLTQSAFGRLFGYGDVEILTASELGVNLFRRIGDPIAFKTAMINAKEELERGTESRHPEDDIPEMIAGLERLHRQGVISDEEFEQKKNELLARL